MGNEVIISRNDEDLENLQPTKMRHRRSHSLGDTRQSLTLSTNSQKSSFLAYSVKESTFATLSVDENGQKTLNEYTILSSLGSGSFAKVKLCMNNNTGKPFVIFKN